MSKPLDGILVWLRRDLRGEDHAALSHALRSARRVWCVFVFDTDILSPLSRADRRVGFIHGSVLALDQDLRALGGGLFVRHGESVGQVTALAKALGVEAVFTNHDYEPAAVQRDARARAALAEAGIGWRSFKDQVVFEADEILTGAGTPYGVFTPYKNAWLKRVQAQDVAAQPVRPHASHLAPLPAHLDAGAPSLQDLGFEPASMSLKPGSRGAQELLQDFLGRIDAYAEARDYPAVKGPSYLGVHLRFGTVSIRELARLARERAVAASRGAEVWLSELIWRDFYHQILHHHPHVVDRPFRAEYDALTWDAGPQADQFFAAWCEGRTGYPLVDAAMAQLNQSGYMHNRLRMLTASFLTKDLGLDWRWGERYFAERLNDYDLAANNGGWQWAASTGCDAQPYFRIFNPVTQSRKFDPQGKFIRRYLPALAGLDDVRIHTPWLAGPMELQGSGVALGRDYPRPLVDHDEARQRTLARFAAARSRAAG
ncbi:MAG TPA: deoxyribodipyrimidine photo-lyase [Burkholderiaceae bacterium]|nr:deoxyribodipyrimidine photo-lyase [Burkholderiaceae bacterium]